MKAETFKGVVIDKRTHIKKPKVSVCVVTYNQERFIRQCLQSLVDQATDFDYEIVVGDDASTDGTQDIVKEFSKKYPNIFRVYMHENNIGAYKNFSFVHEKANGQYIAHMDGDDYALPGKLNAQCKYLDANPDCNIVWHRVKILDPSTNKTVNDYNANTVTNNLRFSRKDILLIGSIGCHSSKMYRSIKNDMGLSRDDVIDFYTDVQHIGSGYACILDEWYGVYRKHTGIASGLTTKRKYISHLNEFLKIYPEFRGAIAANAFLAFIVDIKNGRETWRDALKIWVKVNPVNMISEIWRLYKYVKLFKSPKQ